MNKSKVINRRTRTDQKKSKGQVEADISTALIAFEKEHMGRGPVDVRSYIVEDMLLIRLKGVLTMAEQHLAKDAQGIQLIKQVRAKLLENSCAMLEDVILDITGATVVSFHTDISTKAGERIIVITLDEDLEKKLSYS
ncbi:hypothetical protein DSLASN_30110 [Desulfoluna limicola]|uniref:Na+-translocating membrane potential-generating system MpsC domain-containing protein n=2 Tax=Desulfoluna limicola TaxID=2810562 RepID=A0ABN6F5E2_9BACT|nr:hypothetical protein DSLASN_30110 [Desulfoluna limicola]